MENPQQAPLAPDDEIPTLLVLPQACIAEIEQCIAAFEGVVAACMAGHEPQPLPEPKLARLHGYLLTTLATYTLPEMLYQYNGHYYYLSPYYGPGLKLCITKLCCIGRPNVQNPEIPWTDNRWIWWTELSSTLCQPPAAGGRPSPAVRQPFIKKYSTII